MKVEAATVQPLALPGLLDRRHGQRAEAGVAECLGLEFDPADALGAMMTTPCPLCNKASWTAEVLWMDTSTMGWKATGERSFDRLEGR